VKKLAVVVCTLLAGCTALVAGCTPEPPPAPPPPPDFGRTPVGVATRTGPFDSGPVAAPAASVWVGAWVKPAVWGQDGRRDAVDGFEEALGRPLDVVNTYRTFEEEFGKDTDLEWLERGTTLMLSWASGDTRSIVDGRHDDLIRAQARRVRAARQPILMRFRWEMDRPNLRATMWSAEDFVAAWKHVRAIFADVGADNASWVWCPTAEGFDRGDAPAFYPGDDQVDWTCVDVYASSDYRPLDQLMGRFLEWAAQRPKPIVVGEFGVSREWGAAKRAQWLRDAARVFKANPQIRAVSYFESDPDGNPPTLQFKLSDDPEAFAALRALYRDPYFTG
jgi:hypothetical protein